MLEIEKLTKYYGNVLGVKNLNLNIKKGEIFGFIGPNGAGKSTTIRCIMNMINKTAGKITIGEEELNNKNYFLKEKIGYLASEVYLYDDLTVNQMLDYNQSFYRKDCSKKRKELTKKLELPLNKKIDELSFGNTKKLGIVLALMHEPDLIILDEATSGLDPLMQDVFYEILRNEKQNGKTIFFSSHNLGEIKKLCDRVGIIRDGKLVKIEDINKITNTEYNNVTIISDEISKIKKNIKGKILEEKDNYLKMIYDSDINQLLELLSKHQIKKLLIEEPSIDEIFKHYYE